MQTICHGENICCDGQRGAMPQTPRETSSLLFFFTLCAPKRPCVDEGPRVDEGGDASCQISVPHIHAEEAPKRPRPSRCEWDAALSVEGPGGTVGRGGAACSWQRAGKAEVEEVLSLGGKTLLRKAGSMAFGIGALAAKATRSSQNAQVCHE